eukprot:m.260264 g.260264  ORF g.260264 m.260264 type:complete len:74 (+) comp38972_c0_seq1:56-277(+)
MCINPHRESGWGITAKQQGVNGPEQCVYRVYRVCRAPEIQEEELCCARKRLRRTSEQAAQMVWRYALLSSMGW